MEPEGGARSGGRQEGQRLHLPRTDSRGKGLGPDREGCRRQTYAADGSSWNGKDGSLRRPRPGRYSSGKRSFPELKRPSSFQKSAVVLKYLWDVLVPTMLGEMLRFDLRIVYTSDFSVHFCIAMLTVFILSLASENAFDSDFTLRCVFRGWVHCLTLEYVSCILKTACEITIFILVSGPACQLISLNAQLQQERSYNHRNAFCEFHHRMGFGPFSPPITG